MLRADTSTTEEHHWVYGRFASVDDRSLTLSRTPTGATLHWDSVRRVEARRGEPGTQEAMGGAFLGAGVGIALALGAVAVTNCKDTCATIVLVSGSVVGALFGGFYFGIYPYLQWDPVSRRDLTGTAGRTVGVGVNLRL